jgi:NADH-quinone oxidoreductase subunit N
MAKFMLLTGAYKAGHLPLVILAAINTAIAIYYYLSVVRVTYSASQENRPAVVVGGMARVVSLALVVIMIAMGLVPDQFLQLATDAVRAIL